MISALKTEQADEVKHHDYCKDELHQVEVDTMNAETMKKDLEAKEDDLEVAIKTADEEVAAAYKRIDELQVDLQRASENRKTENVEFQATVADQRATQEILNKALDKLAKFYDS